MPSRGMESLSNSFLGFDLKTSQPKVLTPVHLAYLTWLKESLWRSEIGAGQFRNRAEI